MSKLTVKQVMITFTYQMARETALSVDVQLAFDQILAKHVVANAIEIFTAVENAVRHANGDCHRAIGPVRAEVSKLVDIFPSVDLHIYQECHAIVVRMLRKIAMENRHNESSDIAMNCVDALIEQTYGRL
jgi:hypothetical protein